MKQHWILLVALIPLLTSVSASEGGSSVTTETLVKKHRYPFEKHQVQTSDGYLLTLHRIPYSARVNTSSPRPVAFLMHGLLSSSSDWVILGPGRALGYILSDAGFDIWMGNARGNRYSRNHITLSPESKPFWNFTWHEIGLIDLPDSIDYIRFLTGENQVRYFGHSQGTTTFLVLSSLNMKIKKRIKSAHLLAPVAFLNHAKGPIVRFGAPFLGQPNPSVDLKGSTELAANTKEQESFGKTVCSDSSPMQFFCSILIFLFAGFDPKNLNTSMLPDILATTSAGASANQVYHYAQVYNSGYFRQFDYGPKRNLITYGSKEPPNYQLEKIDVPIFLYYGKNDFFVDSVDVHRLIRQLSNSTLKRAYLVPYANWNHVDFTWGLNAKEQVYDAIMEDVASVQ